MAYTGRWTLLNMSFPGEVIQVCALNVSRQSQAHSFGRSRQSRLRKLYGFWYYPLEITITLTKWRTSSNISQTSPGQNGFWDEMHNSISRGSYKAVKTLRVGWKWSKPISQMVGMNPAPSGTQQCVCALSIQSIRGARQTHFYICSMSGWESTCLLFRLDTTELAGCSWILNIHNTQMIAKTGNHSLYSVSWHISVVLFSIFNKYGGPYLRECSSGTNLVITENIFDLSNHQCLICPAFRIECKLAFRSDCSINQWI